MKAYAVVRRIPYRSDYTVEYFLREEAAIYAMKVGKYEYFKFEVHCAMLCSKRWNEELIWPEFEDIFEYVEIEIQE